MVRSSIWVTRTDYRALDFLDSSMTSAGPPIVLCLFLLSSQVVNIANDQRTLKEIENKILYMLANASGKPYCST